MKHSNQLDYLATIKRNHRIHTNIDKVEGEPFVETMYRHYKAMRHIHRLAGTFTIRPYTVALHCYMTGLLFEDIARMEGITITPYETKIVYRHDLFETVTGDMLLPVKIHSESVRNHWEAIETTLIEEKFNYLRPYNDADMERQFSPAAWNLFKAVDLFELYLFCWEETELGNMSEAIWNVIYNCQRLLPEFHINYITRTVQSPLKNGS